MKRIVSHCLAMLTLCSITSYILAAFGIETVPILTLVFSGFGGELLLTVVIKLGEKSGTKEKQEEKKQ
ncbi:hypothetical protein LJC74_03040 [Eubacteriales bacterium OttesenSCG-928-A19]|nr:hypothetical protein [Eubacteriales bacterium OttesenSCG-928-A19]